MLHLRQNKGLHTGLLSQDAPRSISQIEPHENGETRHDHRALTTVIIGCLVLPRRWASRMNTLSNLHDSHRPTRDLIGPERIFNFRARCAPAYWDYYLPYFFSAIRKFIE